jgi:hypothetical protein
MSRWKEVEEYTRLKGHDVGVMVREQEYKGTIDEVRTISPRVDWMFCEAFPGADHGGFALKVKRRPSTGKRKKLPAVWHIWTKTSEDWEEVESIRGIFDRPATRIRRKENASH